MRWRTDAAVRRRYKLVLPTTREAQHDMIRNALTGEPKPVPKTVVQQESDFTAEGSPPPGHISGTDVPGTDVPGTDEPATPAPRPKPVP